MRVYYVVSVDMSRTVIDYICLGRKLLFKTLSVIMAQNDDIGKITISYTTRIPYGAEPIASGIWEYQPAKSELPISDSLYYDSVCEEGVPF